MNTLADSGYFVGFFNTKDHHHDRCMAFFASSTGITVTTWAVFAEVCALLTHSKQKRFLPGLPKPKLWAICALNRRQ